MDAVIEDEFYTVYRFKDIEGDEELTDMVEIHFIELDNVKGETDEVMR